MSDLAAAQRDFARHVGLLLCHINGTPGYAVTLGDAYRDPRAPYGHPQSVHRKRLAIDLNLFQLIAGVWIYREDSEDHRPFGEWWEGQHPLARWGGRFDPPDGNHYSFTWEGVR